MDSTKKEIEADILFKLKQLFILELHRDEFSLSFLKSLMKVDCVDGVSIHETGISVHLSGKYDDVVDAMDNVKLKITDNFQ